MDVDSLSGTSIISWSLRYSRSHEWNQVYSKLIFTLQLGSAGASIPAYIHLRNRRPPVPFGVRIMGASGMGLVGSFLGFTIGGVAAAMEVNKKMENPTEYVVSFCSSSVPRPCNAPRANS